jgi:hypothetical protein
VRRPQEVAHRQGGTFPVPEHVPVGKQRTSVSHIVLSYSFT